MNALFPKHINFVDDLQKKHKKLANMSKILKTSCFFTTKML